VGQRRALTLSDRADIAAGLKAGHGVRQIARDIGRRPSVVSREITLKSMKTRGYRPVHADLAAQGQAAGPQGRRRPGAACQGLRGPEAVPHAPPDRGAAAPRGGRWQCGTHARLAPADAKTFSHEAISRWIYALPRGEPALRASWCARAAAPADAAGPSASGPAGSSSSRAYPKARTPAPSPTFSSTSSTLCQTSSVSRLDPLVVATLRP